MLGVVGNADGCDLSREPHPLVRFSVFQIRRDICHKTFSIEAATLPAVNLLFDKSVWRPPLLGTAFPALLHLTPFLVWRIGLAHSPSRSQSQEKDSAFRSRLCRLP